MIAIDYRDYQAHKLAWLYVYGVWPPGQIDHVNCVRDDNRIANLRIATPSQNKANQPVRRDSKTGIKGIRFLGRGRLQWQASIRQHGKRKHLGSFSTAEEAHAAYRNAAQEIYGEFGRVE